MGLLGQATRAFLQRHRSGLPMLGVLIVLATGFGTAWLAADWLIARAVELTPVSLETGLAEQLLSSSSGDQEIHDPHVVEVVSRVGQRLLAAEPRQPYHFHFKVVRNPTMNAFAVPGGGIVIFSGLLENAGSADELAGVMAHEIEHVLCRHSLLMVYHGLKWQLVSALVVGHGSGTRELILGEATRLAQLSYGREMESEADAKGAALMVRAGLSPDGMLRFFSRLAEREDKVRLEFASTHPTTAHRLERLTELTRAAQGQPTEPLDVDWKALKKAL